MNFEYEADLDSDVDQVAMPWNLVRVNDKRIGVIIRITAVVASGVKTFAVQLLLLQYQHQLEGKK